ncbi:MAG: helix-turn-helix transcriptional regulator [Planctomycetota bacterium]
MTDGERRGSLEHASRHLPVLYETGKVLARFESVEETLPAVLSRLTETLHMSSTVLIEGGLRHLRTFVWHSPGVGSNELDVEKMHAKDAFEYLVGVRAGRRVLAEETRAELSHAATPRTVSPDARLDLVGRVTLPLVVDRGPVFGVLRTRCGQSLDDVDLAFLNAVTHQIAVAIEHHLPLPQLGLEEWVEPAVARLKRRHGLSPAEARVAEHAIRGLSNKEIARILGTSTATVRTQLLKAYRKLGVESRGLLSYVACCESHRARGPR